MEIDGLQNLARNKGSPSMCLKANAKIPVYLFRTRVKIVIGEINELWCLQETGMY